MTILTFIIIVILVLFVLGSFWGLAGTGPHAASAMRRLPINLFWFTVWWCIWQVQFAYCVTEGLTAIAWCTLRRSW